MISILAGLALPLIPFLLLGLESWLFPQAVASLEETIPPWTSFPVLLVSVVGHEGLHLFWHPGWGLSPQSHLLVWRRRLAVGVQYEGFMSRTRWLAMRLAPLFGLTVLPTLVLLAAYPFGMSFFWQQFTVMVILVNSLGAGGDLVASAIVARQVPWGGEVGNWNGRACWRGE
ncbi:MAG TPA: metalloprotease family protein [Anaerolineae bacterium]|nr:metalloprotease family protein [Anaerolineae bacterium]